MKIEHFDDFMIFHVPIFSFISMTLRQHFQPCYISFLNSDSTIAVMLCTYIFGDHTYRWMIHMYLESLETILFPRNFLHWQWSRWTGKVSLVRTDNARCLHWKGAREHCSLLLRWIRNFYIAEIVSA